MARRPASSAALPIRRQLRRVRRRWNGRALTAGVFGTVAGLGTIGTVLLLCALRASPRGFAVAVAVAGGVTLALGVGLTRRLGRGWLGRRDAALRIDRQSGLDGRLATLVELGEDGSAFGALLLAQNEERLSRWEPRAVVPRLVPRGWCAAATAAVVAVVLVLALAPRLRPPEPDMLVQEEPVSLVPIEGTESYPTRLLVAPVRQAPQPGSRGGGSNRAGRGGGTASDGPPPSALARVQERIRQRLLGEAETRDAPSGGAAGAPPSAEGREAEESGDPHDAARPSGRALAEALPARGGSTPAPGTPPPRRLLEPARDGDERGGAGSGAGTSTDPRLLGAPSETNRGGASAFALALDADVHADRGAGTSAPAAAPPPALDQRPELGARQRAEAPVGREPLPPAYEPLVARLFAHEGER